MTNTATIPLSRDAIKAAIAGLPVGQIVRTDESGIILRHDREGWRFRYERKIRGEIVRAILGPITLPLAEIRQAAGAIYAEAAKAPPAAADRARLAAEDRARTLAAWTLADALAHHADRVAMRPTSRAATAATLRQFARHLPLTMGETTQDAIARAFAIRRDEVAPATLRSQGKALAAIFEAWRLAHPPEARPAFNPATEAFRKSGSRTILPRAVVRDERLAADEIGPWLAACRMLADRAGPIRGAPFLALEFILLTGMRANEAMRLAWAEIEPGDVAAALAPGRMKNGRPWRKPLPIRARAILAARREVATIGSPWAFESWKADGKPLDDLRDALAAIAKAGGKLVRVHDLRRSYASAAARADVADRHTKRLLAHALGDVTEGYIGDLADDLAAPAQRVADRIEADAGL